ncbi:hypothetical protein GGR52DRAFT_572235 [Hypoxylon sp. FL1284]|nr:hypothetical protein GGR52DRAFT_572235 [Hypoxylon sp. FL1284]
MLEAESTPMLVLLIASLAMGAVVDVWKVEKLDPLLTPAEIDVEADSVREGTIPLDITVELWEIVAFVKEKGGIGVGTPDDGVNDPMLEAEPLTVEDAISVVEIGPVPELVARLMVELVAPLGWPVEPLDEMVGPKLSVEFDSGNGGVEKEADEDSPLEGPLETQGGPLDKLVIPTEVIPDGSTVLLGTFVEFVMGNGADVLEI